MAFVFIAAVIAGVASGHVPVVLLFAYLAASLISYVLYCLDKAAAGKGRQRTPEATLHLVDFLGGWPGALLAQYQFRHKTLKASFQSFFWLTVLANVGLYVWLAYSGTARWVADILSG